MKKKTSTAHTVLKLENRPIVVAHISGRLTAGLHFRLALKAAQLLENIPGKVYLVLDFSHAQVDLLSTVEMIRQMTAGWAGTVSDPRVISMLVLNGGNASLAAAHLIRGWDGWRRTFVFASLTQALACARGPILYETEESMSPAR